MDPLAIAERSFYRALLSLHTAADIERGLRDLLPPLLRATASRGVHLELALRGTTVALELGVVSPALRALAIVALNDEERPITSTGAREATETDAYVCCAIAGGGNVYLQRAVTRELTYRHRENIELLKAELGQLCEPAAPADDAADLGIHESTRRYQARLVNAALQRANWNVARAARELGVRRGFIYEIVRDGRRQRGGS